MKTLMKSVLCTIAALAAVSSVYAAKLNTALFAKQSVVTVSGTTGYTGSTDLSNFPVLVKLSAGAPSGFVYADCATDGSDLRFADASGNLLPHEIDTWNATGTSMVWVCVSTLAHGADTTFTMYYGTNGVSALPAVAASDVWTAAGYNAVWHFDSSNKESVHNLSATSSGTVEYRNRTTYPTLMGGGAMWLKNNVFLEYANSADWTTLGDGNTLTLSCWAISESPSYGRMISSKNQWNDAAGYELTTQGNATTITVASSGTTGDNQSQKSGMPSVTSWRHITATYASDGTLSLWVDGVNKGSGPKTKVELKVPTSVLTLGSSKGGGNYWPGGLDEVRIHRGVESDDWIKACYDTMTSATFAVPAAVTYVDPSVTVLVAAFDDPVKNAGNDTIDFGWAVTSVSSANPSTDVKFVYRASGSAVATTNNVTTITAAGSGTYQFTLPDANEIYDCQMLAMDAEDIVASTEWKDIGWLVSSKLNGTTSASMTNAKGTFTSELTTLGTGTTTVTLYLGQDADNLTAVSNYTMTATGPVSFTYQLNAAGTWYAKIGSANTDGAHNWSDETSVATVAVTDNSTYTWVGGASGVWTNAACWATSGDGAAGYPSAESSVAFTDGTAAVITLDSDAGAKSIDFSANELDITFRGTSSTIKLSAKISSFTGTGSSLTIDALTMSSMDGDLSIGGVSNKVSIVGGSSVSVKNFTGSGTDATLVISGSSTYNPQGNTQLTGSGFRILIDNATFYGWNKTEFNGEDFYLRIAGKNGKMFSRAEITFKKACTIEYVIPEGGFSVSPISVGNGNEPIKPEAMATIKISP
ncbi:MAG: DUF2341 domain-containing protein [Kiritimatiellae bacterium]|nr:DUF2341 domain-containing protein [Kiritimatiellia bacterium]